MSGRLRRSWKGHAHEQAAGRGRVDLRRGLRRPHPSTAAPGEQARWSSAGWSRRWRGWHVSQHRDCPDLADWLDVIAMQGETEQWPRVPADGLKVSKEGRKMPTGHGESTPDLAPHNMDSCGRDDRVR